MKTIAVIDESIKAVLEGKKPDETAKNRARKQLEFLRFCRKYLETNPSEDFLKAELESLYHRVDYLNDAYEDYIKNNPEYINEPNPSQKYKKEMNFPQLNNQIKTIIFLLQ